MRLLPLFSPLAILLTSTAVYATQGTQGMVVTEQALASQVGLSILQKGGNAIDAAVAVGFALAVVNPCCGNIGGGGFMTIHLANGKNIFLNFREKAPLRANPLMYIDSRGDVSEDKATLGYLAVATPGTVLGLDTALKQYGTMSIKAVIAPAIHLAQDGYLLSSYEAKQLAEYAPLFRQHPNVAAIFLKDNQPYHAGDRFIQKDLAHSLSLIAESGADAFYKGSIARTIVQESEMNGGILSSADFANYKVEELIPISCNYRGYTIISSPPPSSGGTTLCEMLNILENFQLNELGYHSVESLHYIIEAMRYSFNDRNSKLGDPDFVQNPIEQLISKDYARSISKVIAESSLRSPNESALQTKEQTDTTHYSVIDNKGNAVSVTYTLNGFFGAGVIAGNTGFFLNNEMDDFAISPGSANKFGLVQYQANDIQPGKRPLSSMTPTILMKNGRVVMVVGSPGGPRIITSVLLTILNVIDYGMSIQNAVDSRRFHYQGIPDFVSTEPLALPFFTTKRLELMGYHIHSENPWSAVEAIYITDDGKIIGANDNRRPDGEALGY